MPSSCCAVNCSNRKSTHPELVFYSFPTAKKNLKRRNLWVNSIKRENFNTDVQINNARVCSAHFISGKKSDDPLNPDYVPSIFNTTHNSTTDNSHLEENLSRQHQRLERFERLSKRKRTSSWNNDDDQFPNPVDSLELDFSDISSNQESDAEIINRLKNENKVLLEENAHLRQKLKKLEENNIVVNNDSIKRMNESILLKESIKKLKKRLFSYRYIQYSKAMHLFYTGITKPVFQWLLDQIKKQSSKDKKQKLFCTKKLSMEDHLFLILVKLRLGLKNRDLAYRFGLLFSTVSKIFRSWIKVLAKFMVEYLIYWPEKPALRRNLPKCFKKHYPNAVCIIDCTEIFTERPFSLNARAQTWSNYKNHNTVKYLVVCTPAGAVCFISDGWGGRVSDKEITLKSGILEYIETGDQVLADRGFTVQEEFATKGGILEFPSFTKGKSQLSTNEVDHSRKVANVRIHIERVIGRLRKWTILNTIIPISQVDLTDEIMVTIAGLVNLSPKIV